MRRLKGTTFVQFLMYSKAKKKAKKKSDRFKKNYIFNFFEFQVNLLGKFGCERGDFN